MVEFTLDGKAVSAPEGELLVHAAARYGTFIPTLCHDEKLDPYGGCRMCLVELEGAPRPVPACAQRVRAGMIVSTNGAMNTLPKPSASAAARSSGSRSSRSVMMTSSVSCNARSKVEPGRLSRRCYGFFALCTRT